MREFIRFILMVATVNALIFTVSALLYFLFWPIPIHPEAWDPPDAPELTGRYQSNTALDDVTFLLEGIVDRPEDVAIDSQGRIYAGTEFGNIVRHAPASGLTEIFAYTAGRPMGLDFDAREHLVVADARRGLLSIDPEGGVSVLANQHSDIAFKFLNDVDVAPSGKIYFTDSSDKFDYDEDDEALYEHGPNGRVFVYNPNTQATRMILGDLYFANGIAVSADESFLFVNETGSYRVRKIWLSGADAGRATVILDNLPGFPDGISSNDKGIFWLAIHTPRNGLLDWLSSKPTLRGALYRIPESRRQSDVRYGFVIGIDASGAVLHNLQSPSGKFAPISSVEQYGDTLYLGTNEARAIATIKAP